MQSHEAIRNTVFAQVPHEVWEFVGRLLVLGGFETYVVGGAVRDAVLGIDPHDIDLEVFGISEAELLALEGFAVAPAGDRFGIFLVRQHNTATQFEVSLPQVRERTGSGHGDEIAHINPDLSLEDAAARRDFTMNAIYLSLVDGGLFDPFGGIDDLNDQRLSAISPDNFAHDPLRVLRGVQFCSRFNLTADRATLNAAQDNVRHFEALDDNRIRQEWRKWAGGLFPAAGFDFLVASGWVHCFPALAHLEYIVQDKFWHPEGNVSNHTRLALGALEGHGAGDPVIAFAVLLHDIGKAQTTEFVDGRIVSPGHAGTGADAVIDFFRSAGWDIQTRVPEFIQAVQTLVREHMWLISFQDTPSRRSVRRLANRLSPATVREWAAVCIADALGRGDHPFTPDAPENVEPDISPILDVVDVADTLQVLDDSPQPLIKGRHLIRLGHTPGRVFGDVLDTAFQAQLDGEFNTLIDGIRWVAEKFNERLNVNFDTD